jgi:hypothetical protein
MNTKTTLALVAIVIALAAAIVQYITPTFAVVEENGLANQKNFGQCKQNFNNDNPCENNKGRFTGQ